VQIAAVPPAPLELPIVPQPELPLRVLYEDQALLVLDKPAGMPVHPLRPGQPGTLMNALVSRYPEIRGFGYHPLQAGLLHRLDNDTSGVLVVARNADAFDALREQFRGRSVLKTYLALVEGIVHGDGAIDRPLVHATADRRKMAVLDATDAPASLRRRARAARTLYRVVERLARHTLLEVALRQGMRHQIRVHLAGEGHPLAGDTLYGAQPDRSHDQARPRHFLHASAIDLVHPVRGGPLRVESPLPDDLCGWLERLR
jgi:23S rRNA pseudouridine1911/1915/1917 synthase